LFNSIKDEHEIQLARLELESQVGPIEVVRNFTDELMKKPLKSLLNLTQSNSRNDESDNVRFQDFLTHEVAYGKVQGFVSRGLKARNLERLVRRLGYTREIYVVSKRKSWKRFLKRIFPEGSLGKNCNAFSSDGTVAIRIITNQYFLENCEYVIKVTPSLERKQVKYFADRMFDNLMRFIYRIPASAKARVGKRFLDYLAERGEPSLYFSHGLHPYKGKFHPKMTRALINTVHPDESGTIMDNFAGSGTLLVETGLMGLDSYGIEINPMSVLMANAKCALMRVEPDSLDTSKSQFLTTLKSDLKIFHQQLKGQTTLESMSYPPDPQILDEVRDVDSSVYDDFAPNNVLEEIIIARLIIENEFEDDIKNLLMLGLAIAISDLKRKKKKEFLPRIEGILEDIFRRCLLLNYIKSIIPLETGDGICFLGDTANFTYISEIDNIDGNVNSPPYSTALDYIKNDINQLALLGLVRNSNELDSLEQNMGGNPRARYNSDEMNSKIVQNAAGFPDYAINLIRLMNHFGRQSHAFRLYNFFSLIKGSLSEQFRVLKPGSKIATVIGKNHFKLTDHIEVISSNTIEAGNETYEVSIHNVVNNLKSIDPTPIREKQIQSNYSAKRPIKISLANNNRNNSKSGIYIEIENERVLIQLGEAVGFKPYMVINRYLEKTLRGNIRYESIVILEKP
jgi:site-specific DNA-methyltransferase (cytosine-N4-specific)